MVVTDSFAISTHAIRPIVKESILQVKEICKLYKGVSNLTSIVRVLIRKIIEVSNLYYYTILTTL